VPVVSSTLGDPEVIHAILEAALDGVGSTDEVLDRVLKTAACRAVVKGNTPLTPADGDEIAVHLSSRTTDDDRSVEIPACRHVSQNVIRMRIASGASASRR
ncbi:MAG TPA: hypothetical protein O0X79_07675, partial [Methanocorpusculum sp.]|nr:hypothetical protein [Methanocorpusculum sp.]